MTITKVERRDSFKLIIAIVISILVYITLKESMGHQQATLLSIVSVLLFLWSFGGIPLGVVSLLPLVLFPSFDILSMKETSLNYANPIMFLFIGGFLLSTSIEKHHLHEYLTYKILSWFPNSYMGLITSITFISAILSAFLSNITVAVMLMPIALFLSKDAILKERLLLSVAFGSSIGGTLTLVGTPPNLVLLGFLEGKSSIEITFIGWMVKMFPLVAIMLVVTPFLLSMGLDRKKKIELPKASMDRKKMSLQQKELVTIIITLASILFLNAKIEPFYSGLGLDERMVILAYGLILFLPGLDLLKWNDFNKVPFDVIFLFGAGFSIATAFGVSGIIDSIAEKFSLINHMPQLMIFFLIGIFVAIATQLTSNTAFSAMAIPMFYGIAQAYNLPLETTLMLVTVACSFAFSLPIATPANAIITGEGYVKVKTLIRYGLILNIIAVVLLVFVSYFYW